MSGLWITPADLPDDLDTSEFAAEACEAASYLLWSMSGRKFSGSTTVTEKYGHNLPYVYSEILNLGIELNNLSLIYQGLPEYTNDLHNKIWLRGRPVTDVASVINTDTGLEVDSSAYTLENHSTLVFDHYVTSELEITYTYGQRPPVAGKMAARALAIQFALLWGGREAECSLPDRVISVQRQNVSWVLLDNQDFIAELRTGIYAVDLFLKSVNPHKATQRAKVFSPDIKRGRRQP